MVDKRSICTAVRKKSGSPAGSGSVSGKRRKSHRAQSRQKTGFPINIHAFQSHGTILRSARIWSRAKRISLASIPQRQAPDPKLRDPEPHECDADEKGDQMVEKSELCFSETI